jgi:hypothetical protein
MLHRILFKYLVFRVCWCKLGKCGQDWVVGFDVSACSNLLPSGRDCLVAVLEEKRKGQSDRVEELKIEWKRLWMERLDDKVRAECVANEDYSSLFVEKGTVIFATRNFKLLSFRGILEEHGIGEVYRFVAPSPSVGGWGKFIKSTVLKDRPVGKGRRAERYFVEEEKKPQQLRKGGRGWLHR